MQPGIQRALPLSAVLLGGLLLANPVSSQVPPPQEEPPEQEEEQQPLPPQEPPEEEEQQRRLPQEEQDTPQRQDQPLPPQTEERAPAGQAAARGGNPDMFSYTHVTLLGGDQDLGSGDDAPEGDLLGIAGGVQLGDAAFAQLEWHQGDYEDQGKRTLTELGIGFQEAYSERSSWFFSVGYLRDDWSADELERDDFTWLRGRYGFRWRVTDYIEIDMAAVYSRPAGSSDGSSEWGADAGISAYLGDRIALQFRGRDLDGIAPSTMLGIRVEFDYP